MKVLGKNNMTASSAAAVFVAAFSMLCGCRGIEPESRMVLPAPQNLELILYDDTSLLLTWDPVEGAEHYNVYLVDASTGNAVMTSAGLTETLAGFDSVTAGMSYYCRVRAVAGYDYSDFAVSGTVEVPEPEPEPETN